MEEAKEAYLAGNFPKAIERFTKAIYETAELDEQTKAKAFANRFSSLSLLTPYSPSRTERSATSNYPTTTRQLRTA